MAESLPFKLQPPILSFQMWQQETECIMDSEQKSKSVQQVRFEFRLRLNLHWIIQPLIGEKIMVEERQAPIVVKSFWVDTSTLMCGYMLHRLVSRMLSQMNIDFDMQRSMIGRIASFAHKMRKSASNKGRKMLPMCVDMHVLGVFLYDEREAKGYCGVPASRSSFNTLKNVRLKFNGGDASKEECVICSKKLRKMSKVTRMPCSHVFHGRCITEWLEKSHVCPICRFAMPV